MAIDFLVCGVEHSGTTLVSDLFRQIPHCESGFEVGVMLCDSPRKFLDLHPFIDNLAAGWKLDAGHLPEICDTDSFAEFYARLADASALIDDQVNSIFDKTPRYFAQLGAVLSRTTVPVIATYKDPRALVWSDYSRAGGAEFDQWFDGYAEAKLRYLTSVYRQYEKARDAEAGDDFRRAKCFSLEAICLDTRRTVEAMFGHAGQAFRLDYLIFESLRYKNTRAKAISSRIPFEYRAGMTAAQQRLVVERFSPLTDWFYD